MTCAAPIERTSSTLRVLAYPGDLGAQRRRDLDGEAADATGGPVDQHRVPGLHLSDVADGAQGGLSPPW
jgi:hypothetical protein